MKENLRNDKERKAGVKKQEKKRGFTRFQVLTAASIKMTVFWDPAPCNLVKL
jgi:hypothetical protein